MFAAIYFFCLILSVVFFVWQWSQRPNKITTVVGLIIAFVPLLNIVLAAAVAHELYKKHWK